MSRFGRYDRCDMDGMMREGVGDCCECMARLCAAPECQKLHRAFCETLNVCDNCDGLDWTITYCEDCSMHFCGMQPCIDKHDEEHAILQENEYDEWADS